jgi:hypothetical protein
MDEGAPAVGNEEDSTETHPVTPRARRRQRKGKKPSKRIIFQRSLKTIKNQIDPKKPFDNFYNLGSFL